MSASFSLALHDVSDFPVVRLSGRGLLKGYAAQWVAEMDVLLDKGSPFALLFLNTVENEHHEDQKQRVVWLKKNKKRLAALCRGIVSIEPDKPMRLLKRAQGAALALAFGLTLKIVPDRDEAERLARRLVAGEAVADDNES
jgi:hypothetical protein